MDNPYKYEFTHEYGDGPSGPARSYWLIHGPGARSNMTPVCLHHRKEANPEMTMQSICHALHVAFKAGQSAKAEEVRKALQI